MAALSRRVAQLFQLIGVPLRLVALFQISDGLFLYFLKGFSLGTAGAVLMKDKIQKHAEQGLEPAPRRSGILCSEGRRC